MSERFAGRRGTHWGHRRAETRAVSDNTSAEKGRFRKRSRPFFVAREHTSTHRNAVWGGHGGENCVRRAVSAGVRREEAGCGAVSAVDGAHTGAHMGRGAGKNTEDRREKQRRVKGFATIPISPYVRGVRARVRAYRVGTAGSARIYPKVIQTDPKKTPKGILELS